MTHTQCVCMSYPLHSYFTVHSVECIQCLCVLFSHTDFFFIRDLLKLYTHFCFVCIYVDFLSIQCKMHQLQLRSVAHSVSDSSKGLTFFCHHELLEYFRFRSLIIILSKFSRFSKNLISNSFLKHG